MAARKKNAQKDYEQFSKRLSKWLLIFWAVYGTFTLIAAILRPEITTGLNALTTGVDDAAMCVVISYTVNSATEKVVVNYFAAKAGERKKLFASLGSGDDEEEEEKDKKEDDNG